MPTTAMTLSIPSHRKAFLASTAGAAGDRAVVPLKKVSL